jgi:hypothetical protein
MKTEAAAPQRCSQTQSNLIIPGQTMKEQKLAGDGTNWERPGFADYQKTN